MFTEEQRKMEMNAEILAAILDAYAYEVVFVDRDHIVRFLNKAAKKKYGSMVKVGNSIFNCQVAINSC